MLDQPEKPFLTVETGEAYQPIRLTYNILNKEKLFQRLDDIKCLEKNSGGNWQWFWKEEADEIHFESVDNFERNMTHPMRLGSFSFRHEQLYLNLASFKRACLAVPLFHRLIDPAFAKIHYADFLNKVYATDERLPHGFTDLFKEDELQAMLTQRLEDYHRMQERCENAPTIEEAMAALTEYTERESHKKLPFAERYEFELKEGEDPDMIFLGFYIFLRGRELVAIRRWFGEAGYTLSDAMDETIAKVFGDVGIDIVE